MLTEVCAEIRNYFVTEIRYGDFTISGGKVAPLDFIQQNQYFRIVGSVFNDGVYKNDEKLNLTDEVFEGAIWAMSCPPDFIALSAKIQKYCEQNIESNFVSESFGGYSYTKVTNSDGSVAGWRDVFRKDLKKYRKL